MWPVHGGTWWKFFFSLALHEAHSHKKQKSCTNNKQLNFVLSLCSWYCHLLNSFTSVDLHLLLETAQFVQMSFFYHLTSPYGRRVFPLFIVNSSVEIPLESWMWALLSLLITVLHLYLGLFLPVFEILIKEAHCTNKHSMSQKKSELPKKKKRRNAMI